MYTANTMASAAEALGMSLPGSAAPPAPDARRDHYAERSGEAAVAPRRRRHHRPPILTKEAFENAITVVMALGGSTNAVLHLLAIAHEAKVELTLDDFNRIGDKVPHLADVKPFGQYVMTDVDRIGGVPVVMKALLDAGLLHGDVADRHRAARWPRTSRELAPPDPDGKIIRALGSPDPQDRRVDDPARLARPGRCGGEERRVRRGRVRGHRPGLRPRAGRDGRARRGHSCSRTTSS